MNEYQEETHYQVALTNRQVLTAFVVLLMCLFVAFFAGVWIGRGARDEPVPDTIAQAGDPTDETFRFFGESATADSAPAGSQPASDDGGDQAPPPQVMRPKSESSEKQSTSLKPIDRSTTQTAKKKPAPTPTPAKKQTAPAPQPAKPAAASTTPASPSGILVQVFSGTDRQQAQGLVTRLQRAGHKAFISDAEVDGQARYRVRVGPFGSRSEAQRQATSIEKAFQLDSWILTAP